MATASIGGAPGMYTFNYFELSMSDYIFFYFVSDFWFLYLNAVFWMLNSSYINDILTNIIHYYSRLHRYNDIIVCKGKALRTIPAPLPSLSFLYLFVISLAIFNATSSWNILMCVGEEDIWVYYMLTVIVQRTNLMPISCSIFVIALFT